MTAEQTLDGTLPPARPGAPAAPGRSTPPLSLSEGRRWVPPLALSDTQKMRPVTDPTRLGPFELVRALGQGSFGSTFLARDTRTGRPVTLKVQGSTSTPESLRRLEREVAALGRLDHALVPSLQESGSVAGRTYLALDYVAGHSLRRYLQRGPLSLTIALRLVATLADVLAHCHRRGVVHGDLKPENVVIDERGAPHLLDFGLTQVQGMSLHPGPAGTPSYMAPEQFQGGTMSRRTELFQLGMLLLEALAGESPSLERGETPQLRDLVRRLPRLPASLPPAVTELVWRMINPDPEERFADVEEFLRSLAPLLRALSAGQGTPVGEAAA